MLCGVVQYVVEIFGVTETEAEPRAYNASQLFPHYLFIDFNIIYPILRREPGGES